MDRKIDTVIYTHYSFIRVLHSWTAFPWVSLLRGRGDEASKNPPLPLLPQCLQTRDLSIHFDALVPGLPQTLDLHLRQPQAGDDEAGAIWRGDGLELDPISNQAGGGDILAPSLAQVVLVQDRVFRRDDQHAFARLPGL